MHTLRIYGWLLALAISLPMLNARAEDAPLFPDRNLEKAVRKQVFEKRDNDKPLVEADVSSLSTIKADGMGITNLAGLEKCVSLASLELAKNKIKDLTPLKDLKLVQFLTLNDNQIEDITPLGGMKSLQYVELSRNKVKDISPLTSCTNMASLYLSQNQITDLSPAFKFARLATLYADGNKIKSIEGINQLKYLTSLSLSDNEISDLKPLIGMTSMYSGLYLERNKIKDLSPLVEMARKDTEHRSAPFLRVYLKGNPLSSASKNGNIKELEEIGMRINK
jgi:Leucine-rich repeat (LRR) protein